MTVGAGEKNGIVRRDLVEVIARGELRRLPKCFDPTAARDPFSALRFRSALFHLREKIFEGVGAFEIQIYLALADAEDMAVRIGQTRHDGFPIEIDDARVVALNFLGVRVRADQDDAPVFGRERFRVRRVLVPGVNISVDENGRLRVERTRAHPEYRDEKRNRELHPNIFAARAANVERGSRPS